MSGWEMVAVRDVADVFDGPHATPAKTEDGPWYLSISSLSNGRFSFAQSAHLSDVDLPRWTKRVAPRPGDTLFSYETRLGEAAYWDHDVPAALGRRMGLLRPKQGKVEPRYLAYAYLGPQFQDVIREKTLHGATVNRIPVGEMPSWPILLPQIEDQRAILGVLDAMDDLIENNRRRVAVLEGMARAIYREWFVKFRYPGHEDVPLVDSALGLIPEGWSAGILDDIVTVSKASVDPATLDPETSAVGLEHIPRQQITLDDWGKAGSQGSRKAVFEKGDVLFGKIRPYFHKVSVAPVDGICSTDAIVIRPHAAHWGQAVFAASSAEFVTHATQTSNGTKMPRADWKVLGKWPLTIPPTQIAESFSELARHHLALAETLMFENRRLVAMRDLLLPKLVTGQIDVSGLDLDVLMEEQVAS
ncbi:MULTISPECIES: restriction endonuclease subunit S [Micrococcales]|uniref:Restriction endonuclease subunit S n=1 Tax=Micrococcus yunnanensis TaxID=566027 RepID=A0AAP5T792_9MICC|nr:MULTISPECIES: restriction endonuclease subunit S [Micrococcales]MDV7177322.1 restriction endonuclease subunit S [Micrococcus yunnanensis]WHM17385.1 restriction endonuclease subunit S [Micrococcus yunnanensis]